MKISEIIEKLEQHVSWLEQLKNVDQETFYRPIAEGKWSLAALVAHFKYWDQIVLDNRMPAQDLTVQSGRLNFKEDEVNKEAEEYAHSGIEQAALINEVVATRKKFIRTLTNLPSEAWDVLLKIGDHTTTFKDYIGELTEHDKHHQNQVS